MAASLIKKLLSALYGGASALFFAPLLWPIVIYHQQGHLSSSLLVGLLAVAFFALLGGLTFGLFVGFPLLVLFERLHLSNPLFIVVAGAIASAVVFSKFLSWSLSSWPLYIFFLIVGGLCSSVAALKMRSNPAFKRDALKRAP
jgi:uncharacterized membrane protein